MARQEHSREDIIREATALVERVECEVPGFPQPIVIGFRRDGSASFFLSEDFVVQFNSSGQLRRAFWQGQLIKADQGRLLFMHRERNAEEVVLRTVALNDNEMAEFSTLIKDQLGALLKSIIAEEIKVLRQIPPEAPLLDRVLTWLRTHAERIAIARKPNAG